MLDPIIMMSFDTKSMAVALGGAKEDIDAGPKAVLNLLEALEYLKDQRIYYQHKCYVLSVRITF